MIKRKIFIFNFNLKNKANRGYLLIESMIGISIAVVGILGILSLISRSVSLNRVVGDQFTGAYLAAEGIEIVKNLIGANIINRRPWNSGFMDGDFEADYLSMFLDSGRNRRLLFDSTSRLYSYQTGSPTNFIRTIKIELIGSGEIKVNSVVRWTSRGGGEFEANLENHFFNWYP